MPGKPPTLQAAPVLRIERGWRVFVFYSGALVLTGLVSLIFADLLWRTGWSAARTVLLALFVVLFLFTAIGCMHGVYGFFIRIFGTQRRITALKPYREQSIDGVSTAIIFPIYNEDSVRDFLRENAKRVTPVALETVEACRAAMGIGHSIYRA